MTEQTKELLVFIESGLIAAAKAYMEAANLPKEALPSVIHAARSHFGLETLVEYQMGLHPDRRRAMVGATPGFVITDLRLKEIDDFVRMNRFPYNCLYIAQDGSIAIRATGWRLKAQADSRIFKGWEEEPTEIIKLDDGNILFRTRVVAVFWTGDRFPAEGAVDLTEMQTRRRKTDAPPSFALMISETRGKTRALRDAIGLPFEIAEDVVAGQEQITVEATVAPVTTLTLARMSVVEFLGRCRTELHLQVPAILSGLNIKNLGEVSNYNAAFKTLADGQKGTPASSPASV